MFYVVQYRPIHLDKNKNAKMLSGWSYKMIKHAHVVKYQELERLHHSSCYIFLQTNYERARSKCRMLISNLDIKMNILVFIIMIVLFRQSILFFLTEK